jgi:Pyruvate/2-oxoacid:ferredoxin oxidoreductase gamma subunit
MSTTATLEKSVMQLEDATVRFCGDSGDGMQLAGGQFTNTSALVGNDIATFPDFPAEIRAPQGTLARLPASAVSKFTFPARTFTRRATRLMRSLR